MTVGLESTGILPESGAIVVPGLMIAVGIVGIVVPVLPGLTLTLAGVLVWAISIGTGWAWAVFAACAVMFLAGVALQYAIPGRRLRASGVSTLTLVVAVCLGIVGFFVVPVIGGPGGFVLGIYLVEQSRARDARAAWAATVSALKAVALSMGIELAAGLAIATTWVVAVVASH